MKKQILIVIICMTNTFVIFAQNYVTLTFTAKLQDNTFITLDSVKVTNTTRGWTEILYCPDTTLRMINSVTINEKENQSFKLYQNIPNPCKGNTSIRIQLPNNEKVNIKLYDINGKEVASYSKKMESGIHDFSLTVGAAQLYVLQVKTATQMQSLQFVSVESGMGYEIKHTACLPSQQPIIQKATTTFPFVSNDSLQFVAYATFNGSVKTKTLNISQPGTQTTYTFVIPMGYAVGDVYYDSNGIAEGIVCWLADTVITYEGTLYGNHGKMISLDEGNGLMYSANNSAFPTRAYDSLDGRVNTAIHIALTLDTNYWMPQRLEGAIWCVSKGEGWYFPALFELRAVSRLVISLNSSLNKIGATPFTTAMLCDIYWSSTERVQIGNNPCSAYGVYFQDGMISSNAVYSKLRVRAMKWF